MQTFQSGYTFSLLAMALICTVQLRAQPGTYHVQLFNEAHGIRTGNNQRIDITKDRDNFLWIMQTTMVQRFDGRQVTDFTFPENLGSLLCDKKGNVWVTSDTRVYRYVQKSQKFEQVEIEHEQQIAPGTVFQFMDSAVWLHTASGFFEFDPKDNLFKGVLQEVPETRNISKRNFTYFKNVIFFHFWDSLFSYNIKTKLKRGIAKQPGVDIFALSEDLVLSTSWEYNSYWHDFDKKRTSPAYAPSVQQKTRPDFLYVKDVKQLDADRFIIGTRQGIFEYSKGGNIFKKLRYYNGGKQVTNDGSINRIYIDAEKMVWLGFSEGIAHYNHFEDGIGLMRNNDLDKIKTWSNSAANFAEDAAGNIWFVNGNGFASWNVSTHVITSFPPEHGAKDRLSHFSIRGIVSDGRYLILGPTDKGLWLYEPVQHRFRRPVYPKGEEGEKLRNSSEHDFVDQIRTIHNGNHVVVGRDTLYLLDGKTYALSFLNVLPGKENANFVHNDSQKRVWIGTGTGLHCLDSNLNYLFKVKSSLGTLRSFCVWGPDEILVSGSKGIFLVKWRAGSAAAEIFHSFFNEMSVSLLYKDRNSKLWVGTNGGLYRVDSATKKRELFDYANNVQGNGFFNDASFRSSTGILFLGGVNGINYFVPEKIPPSNHFLKVSIQKLRVNDDDSSYVIGSPLSLHSHQRSMEVRFTAPYYFNATKVRYRYRMVGYDDDWKDIGNNNSVLFTSLPSGNFIFRVAASIDGINWYESSDRISFSIAPHFWQTWWFVILIQALIALSIYGVYKYRLDKQLAVERFRTQISRDLHDDIGSTLSSINILARSSKESNSPVPEEREVLLQKIQHRSQKMLDAMDDLIWNTKPGNESMESLTVRMREYAAEVLEPAGISFLLECPVALNSIRLQLAHRKNIYLIFKEAVNNLAKYSKSGTASIHFNYKKDSLEMRIRDEGAGFTEAVARKGNGLQNMRSRAAEMHAEIQVISGPGSGTEVRLTVPL